MRSMIEYVYLTLVTGAILGSCVYLEKKNSEDYKACLMKAGNVIECEVLEK